MTTPNRIIASLILLAGLLATTLLLKFSWLYAIATALTVAAMLFYPAIKALIIWRAKKLGVPFTYTEGPYVLFRDEKIEILTASTVLDELLSTMMEYADLSLPTPWIPEERLPKGSLSILAWRIVLKGDYRVDPAYIRMRRESKKRHDQKYATGA